MKYKVLNILFLLLWVPVSFAQVPVAQKGVLDLRGWDFDNKTLKLDGEWEFYWNKLLTPQDFSPQKYAADAYSIVPEYWSKTIINGKNLPPQGYATYRLIILTDRKVENLRVIFPAVNTAMKVWWNGKFLGETGKVGTSEKNSVPSLASIDREVTLDSPRVEVLVQISNFQHREGGFFYSPRLGNLHSVFIYENRKLFVDIFLIGSMIIMAIYHLGLFLLRRKNLAAFSFFLFSLLLALRLFVTDNQLFLSIFPGATYDLKYRIEYFTFFFIPLALNYYIYEVVKDKSVKYFLYGTLAVALLASVTLFFKPLVFTGIMPYYQLVYLVTMIFDTYIILKHWYLRTPGSDILFVTFVLVFIIIINDILYYLRIIESLTLTPLGIFILVLGQSLVLASIFTKAFKQNEMLRQELEYKSQNLEKMVKERTKEIERQKRKLEKQNKILQEQTQALEEKDQQLTSSLEYAATMQSAIMPPADLLNKYFDNFLLFLPRDIVSGDGYWFTDKNPEYLFVAVYDCTGHGVPAAFLSIIGSYLLRTTVVEKNIIEPNRILEQIDEKLKMFLLRQGSDGMEMAVLRIEKEPDEPQIKFATAKMELFYYNSRTRMVTRHRGTRKALGYSSLPQNPESFSNFIITFKKNDAIYALSDGYLDQTNKEKKRFGTDKFMEILRKIGDRPMWEQKRILHETIVEYMDDTRQRDDIIILGIKNAPFSQPEQG